MKCFRTTLTATAMVLAPISSFAASTINPNAPAQNAALNSAPIRSNFQSAYNDINNLLSMYYGPSAPQSPSNLQSWANSSGYPVIVLSYYNAARAAWIAYAQINVTANTYQPLVGAGVAAVPPIGVSYPSGIATFALNYGADFTLSGSSLALAAVNATPGTFGDATHVAQVSVDAKGRTTAASNVIITHAANDLAAANNLSDLASPAAARSSLGLGALAVANPGTGLAVDGSGNADLQPGTGTTIGGVEALAPATHQFMTGIAGGVPSAAQPQASDVAGLGSLATANAGTGISISGGAANLQPAQAATIGGVESDASSPHQWIAYIDSAGVPHQSQPQFSDIAGAASASQLPTGTSSAPGIVQCDGTTVQCNAGKITAIGGQATSVTVGSTTIAGGTPGKIEYNKANVLGEGNFSVNVQSFTAHGTFTYTPSPGLVFAEFVCTGAGGGSGGASAGNGTAGFSGGGGGSGGWSGAWASAATIGASQTVTVGTGGPAGGNPSNGSNGGATSIGSLCTANGGNGGAAWDNTSNFGTGGGGGLAGAGNEFATAGNAGGQGVEGTIYGMGGTGAPANYGGGTTAGIAGGSSSGNGVTGAACGAGAAGGGSGTTAPASHGASGHDGCVHVTEYILN